MRQETAVHGPAEGTVRVGIAVAIPTILRSLGVDPAEVVAEAGFDQDVLADPDNWISYAARGRLLSRCVARTGCNHFGLLVGQQGRLSALGLVGFLVQHSPDVETALRSLVRFTHLHVRGAVSRLTVDGNLAILSFDVYLPHVEATDQVGDGAVAMFFNMMRTLCGPEWKPVEARFAHRKPKDVRPYRAFFRAPLLFDDEQNAVVFHSSWLRHRLPQEDAVLRRHLEQHVEAIETRLGDDFPEQVRTVLRTALLSDHASARGWLPGRHLSLRRMRIRKAQGKFCRLFPADCW